MAITLFFCLIREHECMHGLCCYFSLVWNEYIIQVKLAERDTALGREKKRSGSKRKKREAVCRRHKQGAFNACVGWWLQKVEMEKNLWMVSTNIYIYIYGWSYGYFYLMRWLLDILRTKKKKWKEGRICADFTAGAVGQQEPFRLLWLHNCLRHVMFWRDIRLTSLTFQRYRVWLSCFPCFSFVLIEINI